MATHLAHRLPWASLGDIYVSAKGEDSEGRKRWVRTEAQEKQIAHFARCFIDALKEFAETDKRPATDEDGNSLDPTTWDIEPYGFAGYTGYYYSLLGGYLQLNLLLLDANKFLPILQRGVKSVPHYIGVLCGYMDGGHPEWIAERLHPILTEDSYELRPMTAESLQVIRDHCALLFRCLYSISGENRALDQEFVARNIEP